MIELDYLDSLVAELWLRKVEDKRSSATQLMRELFAEERLRPKQQKRVRDLFHGMLSNARLVEHALRLAAPGEIVDGLLAPISVLASRVLSGDLAPNVAARTLPWIDWSRIRGIRHEVETASDEVERIALMASLPPWLARRFREHFGEEAYACAVGLAGRAPTTLRANTLLTSREELADLLGRQGIDTQPTTLAPNGLEVLTPAQLFRTKEFHRGLFELQDEASQLIAELVSARPAALVVDACAGAGGKSLAIAANLQGRGTLVALDTHEGRLKELRRRARRAGVKNLRVLRVEADRWSAEVDALVSKADRVLLDVPCSGLGSLRRNPDMRDRLEPTESQRLAHIQADLCDRAASLLKSGARIIYATCTVLPEENEDIVEGCLQRHPQLSPVVIAEAVGDRLGAEVAHAETPYMQTWPHRHGCDGFFAAVLERQE